MEERTISNTLDRIDVKVEGILNDFKTGIIEQPEAQKMLVSLCANVAIAKMRNLFLQFKKMRDKQKQYFLTRDSKVLQDSKKLEKELDDKIKTFLEVEENRNKTELPLNG